MAFGQFDNAQSDLGGHAPMSQINVTPFVDVMLVLLVIFMIAAPLMVGNVGVDLPQSASVEAQDSTKPQLLRVVVQADGSYAINDVVLDKLGVEQRLDAWAAQMPDAELQVYADTNVAYGKVVSLIGLAQSKGLRRIAFVAQEEQ